MQLSSGLALLAVTASLGECFSPSGGYAPGVVSCPPNANFLRKAGVSDNEKSWLNKRLANVRQPLKDYLGRVWSNYNDKSIIDAALDNDDLSKVPRIGIAVEGGGYVAMFAGAGMLAAMDERTVGAKEHGLGGILQASSYLTGLSGGSWLVGTLALNNWTSVQSIIDNTPKKNSIWDITNSIVAPGGIHILQTTQRFFQLFKMAGEKRLKGFPLTVTDIWGPALAYNFMPNLPNGGAGTLWSDVRNYEPFQNGEMPFPILVATARGAQAKENYNVNYTVVEMNPFELGSWDRSLDAFFDMKYVGSDVSNGSPIKCWAGYDQASFVMGASSNVFDLFHLTDYPWIWKIFDRFISIFTGDLNNDTAMIRHNPFKNSKFTASDYFATLSKSDDLILTDGGDETEGIPTNPLVQKERELDVVFALDLWGTVKSTPDGSSLAISYSRQFMSQGNSTVFPQVPDKETFAKENLTQRPVFFGCYPEDLTGFEQTPPLVVYLANRNLVAPPADLMKLNYSPDERIKAIRNGFQSATANNLTQYKDFNACVGCAVMKRTQEKLGLELPEECNKCFEEFCWRPSSGVAPLALAAPVVAPTPSSVSVDSEIMSSNASPITGSDLSAIFETISAALLATQSGESAVVQPTTTA